MALHSSAERVASTFAVEMAVDAQRGWKPRYNITPGTGVAAVFADRGKAGALGLDWLHWGLVPAWAKDTRIAFRLINARAETVTQKAAFADAIRYRRCLLPADGFYEWHRGTGMPQPHYFYPADGELLGIAGIWEYWLHPGGSEIFSVALLTRAADATMAPVHHRMPVLLRSDKWAQWLDPELVKPDINGFCRAVLPAAALRLHAVGPEVNKGDTDYPDLIRPWKPPAEQLDLF